MTFTLINRSQQTVQIRTDDNMVALPPQQQTTVSGNDNTLECTLTPLMASSYDHYTGFDFITESRYRFTAAKHEATIELQVIKLSGWEFYTYVNAVSNEAAVSLLSAAVADESALRQCLAQHKDFQQPHKRPKRGKTFDLVLSLLEGTPLAVILFFVGKANFGIAAGVIGILLGYLIAAATALLLRAVLRHTPLKEEAPESKAEALNRCLDKSYVMSAITDNSRYRNVI